VQRCRLKSGVTIWIVCVDVGAVIEQAPHCLLALVVDRDVERSVALHMTSEVC
jgi:hypothetical protein